MEDKKELTWTEFRKQVFESIFKIIENSNCSTYKVMGYNFLDVRLVVYYHDCNQVFDYKKDGNEIKITKFFTADKTDEERTEEQIQWKKDNEIDKPEIKEDDTAGSKG